MLYLQDKYLSDIFSSLYIPLLSMVPLKTQIHRLQKAQSQHLFLFLDHHTCERFYLNHSIPEFVVFLLAQVHEPACLIEVRGLAPFLLRNGYMVCLALATPAAVPTPISETSFTEILASGLTFLSQILAELNPL